MKTELTEINKLADDRLALQRQVLELKAKLEAFRTELCNTRTDWLNDHVSLTAKLDASTQAYALLASHRDRLAEALAAIVQKSYLRTGPHEDCHVHPDLIEQGRLALGDAK